MKKHFFILLLLAFVMLIGCSKSSNPIQSGDFASQFSDLAPISDPQLLADIDESFNTGNGKVILGAFQIVPDNETGLVKIIPYDDRELMGHYNVNRFLKKPYCPIDECWGYAIRDYDLEERIFLIELLVYNPTPVTAYDARVIFIDLFDTDIDPLTGELDTSNDFEVLNADGWTKILDDEDKDPEMNPYILFNREEFPEPDYPNPSRAFTGRTLDSEFLVIRFPETVEYRPIFLFEASYPGQAQEVIQFLSIDQRPPMNPADAGFSYVMCAMFDHQGEDPDMHVYFSCPAVLGVDSNEDPIEIEMEKWYLDPVTPADRVFLSWIVKVTNLEDLRIVGNYPAMIRAETPNPGDFDTYYKFPFKVRRNPGDVGHTDYDSAIAFSSFETGDGDIWVADNIYITRKFNATDEPDSLEIDPTWAKKGNYWYLYFASNANYSQPGNDDLDLYVHIFQLNGTQMVRITANPYLLTGGMPGDERAPCVSPNIDFMVFEGEDGEGGDWEIWRGDFNIAGEPTGFTQPPQNLTANGYDDRNPSIDLFGNYMLFDSDIYGGSEHDIFGMRPVLGSQIENLINSGTDDTEPACNPYNPNFFLFTHKSGSPGKTDIMRAEIQGIVVVDVKNLTESMSDSDEKNACWAPSGEIIIFQSNKGADGDYELYTVDWDGNGLDQITYNEWDDIAPAWAPVP